MVHEKHFAKEKATRYQPFFKIFVYLDKLPQQQLPATVQFPKNTLIYKKELCQDKSYQLPSNFQSILVFRSMARTSATSYQPVLKKKISKGKATSYYLIFKVSFYLDQLLEHKLPATKPFPEEIFM